MTDYALNAPQKEERLNAAKKLMQDKKITFPPLSSEVNNHVHTIYSFSPYSPTMAAFKAKEAALMAVGIMDHDSVSGCLEMLEAGKIFSIATTAGFELRVSFKNTKYANTKLNNPDSKGIAYIAAHGTPQNNIAKAVDFLKPLQEARNKRNRVMVEAINRKLSSLIGHIDFDKDVYPLSENQNGGSITERHLLYALSRRLVEKFGKGQKLVEFLENELSLDLPVKLKRFLQDKDNPHYLYDLLGVFKSTLLKEIYVQPTEECIEVDKAIKFMQSINAIPVYAYLGDVSESPTGDKKAAKFEDDFLDDLLPLLKDLGFQGITYMPPRNTIAQLDRISALCRQYDLMEISGVDINSSRQSFNCPEILDPRFAHLVEATWALIAHEKLAAINPVWGFFHPENPLAEKSLTDRLAIYAKAGKASDPKEPEKMDYYFKKLI